MTGSDLIPPASALTPYDPVAARITCALSNRELVSAGEHVARLSAQLEALGAQLERVEESAVLRERQHVAERDELVRTRDRLTRDVARLEADAAGLKADIAQLTAAVERLTRDAASTAQRTEDGLRIEKLALDEPDQGVRATVAGALR